MTEPITLSAAVISALAFQKFVEGVGSETGKKFADKAFGLIDQLRKKIVGKFKGNRTVETAIVKAGEGDSESIETIGDYLKIAMREAPEFAQELQTLAQEINQCVIQDSHAPIQVNYGNQNKQINNYGGENYTADSITVNKT